MSLFVRKRIILFVFALACSGAIFSQQNNIWYFGRKAGLNFAPASGQPVPTILANSAMTADEASATICDDAGNLLFYTNGQTIYDRNHQVMANGDNLDGSISAAQMAIVPQPGSSDIFYVFTTGSIELGFANGYRYSVVNMTFNGGLGGVTSKNNLLWASATERMATVRHANGIDVWLITNDKYSNVFRSWLITCTGIQPAVISTVGEVLDDHIDMDVGTLKATPDGSRICQTHFPIFDEFNNFPNFFQLFDFNNATGVLSNPLKIEFPDAQYTHCTFSADSKKLYVSRPYGKKIDQFDISLPAPSVATSQFTLNTNARYFDIQLAPDERIYISNPNGDIGVIKFPNLQGAACGLQERAYLLSPGSSYIGLPSVVNDIVAFNDPNNGFDYTIVDSCSGTVQFSAHSAFGAPVSWAWDFGDGTTSTQQNPLHVFPDPLGLYKVTLVISSASVCGTITRSKNIIPSGLSEITVDFNFINVCDSGYVRFTNKTVASQPGINFFWDFGDGATSTMTDPTHTYGSSGNYTVKLKTNTGTPCLDDSISYDVTVNTLSISTIPDRVINLGETVVLTTNGPSDATYTWSPSTWLNDNSIQSPIAKPDEDITYIITAVNSENCKSVDSVKITVIQPEDIDDIYIPTAFTPNNDGKNDVIRPFLPRKYNLDEYSIFNRSGQRVFTTAERGVGWNGMIGGLVQNSDVFIWVLKATDPDGNKILRKGTLMLIR